jgi:hypothetical protein
MAYRADTDDPTANVPLMTALGRLVVRAAELDEDVGASLARLCDRKTKKSLKRRSLYWKLSALQSIAAQLKEADELFVALSDFCSQCLAKLKDRNSPVHSTYLMDEELGIIKWDPRHGPEVIQAEDIERDAAELKRFADKAVEYNIRVRQLRAFGVLKGEYVPVLPEHRRSCPDVAAP